MKFQIESASRNKIVLSTRKEQFLYLKYGPNYSKVNAFNLCMLAKASYLEKEEVKEFLFLKTQKEDRKVGFTKTMNVSSPFLNECLWGLKNIEKDFGFMEVLETNTQFFYFETAEYFLFSFRGTKESADWTTNTNAQMTKFLDGVGGVHAGFHKAFLSVKELVDTIVKNNFDKPIIICGHSLGGAISNLVGAYLRKKGHQKVMIYTFGSPLVGDSEFSHHFSVVQPIISYRFVHNQDLIPMIPPPHSRLRINLLPLVLVNPLFLIPATIDPFGKPFNHFGKLVFIRRIDAQTFSVDVDRKTPAYLRVPTSAFINVERPLWDNLLNWTQASANDHFMENYISILGSDLKSAIACFSGINAATIIRTQKIIAYLEIELKAIKASHAELEKTMLMSLGRNPYADTDATSTGATPPDKMSPSQKMNLLEDAMHAKQMELMLKKGFLTVVQSPSYSQSILQDIIDIKMNATLKQEFGYQSKHITY